MTNSISIEILEDKEMRRINRTSLNRICDITEWSVGSDLSRIMIDLREGGYVHRKSWEYAACISGMEHFGLVRSDAKALAVGAGSERPLYYFANHIEKMVATDLYDNINHEGTPLMLENPEYFAPFAFRRNHLEVLEMSGTNLIFDENTFDFAFTLSSIEHFGSRQNQSKAMLEMERVLKPGGVACVATELILNQTSHQEYFTIEELNDVIINSHGMKLVGGEPDLRISKSLVENPIDLNNGICHNKSPHIVLKENGILWTSIILFFQKQTI